MADRTTKILLTLIAIGLWANLLGDRLLPARLQAQTVTDATLTGIYTRIGTLLTNVSSIANGTCTNSAICGPVNQPTLSAQRQQADRGYQVVKVQIVSIDQAPGLAWEPLPVEVP